VQQSERHVNSAYGFFTGYSNGQGSLRKVASVDADARVFPLFVGWFGPDLAQRYSLFSISFYYQIRKFAEINRKIIKI
jgi:hypothetical protein